MGLAFQDLRQAVGKLRNRAHNARALTAKDEMALNVYPTLDLILERVDVRFSELEEAVFEMLSESHLDGPLSMQIIGVLEAGLQLARACEAAGYQNDIIAKFSAAYLAAAPGVMEQVVAVTEDDDDDDGDEPADAANDLETTDAEVVDDANEDA